MMEESTEQDVESGVEKTEISPIGEGQLIEENLKVGEGGDVKEKLDDAEGEHLEGEQREGEQPEGEQPEGEQPEGEQREGEQPEGEQQEGEQLEGEQPEGEHIDGEHVESEQGIEEDKEKVLVEGEEMMGEIMEGEQIEGEQEVVEVTEQKPPVEEVVEEEERFIEEPPPDPAAPFDFSDSKEALKEPFQLRLEQIAEVEQLWELYQNYTPAYTDIDGYITEKELVYMLKSLLLMTYTPEQLQELIAYCVRPPHPEGHINYDQFLKMVTIRQRDFPIEDELRGALQVFDPDRTGSMDREYLKEVLAKQGNKMPQKQLDNLIKEVDMSNDGTIGVEDVIGTMCIDLNKEDLMMLMAAIFPPDEPPPPPDDI